MISISLEVHFIFRPPSGCLQYLFGNRVGTFETFNFASGSGHLVNQNYAVCIRQEFGLLSSRNANMTKSNNIFIFQAIAAYSTEFVMHQEPFLWIPMDLRRQAHRKLKQDVLEISSKLKVISRFQQQFNNWNLNQFFATLSSWLLCAYFFSTWLALCFNRKNRSFWIVNQFLTSFSFLLGSASICSLMNTVNRFCGTVFADTNIASINSIPLCGMSNSFIITLHTEIQKVMHFTIHFFQIARLPLSWISAQIMQRMRQIRALVEVTPYLIRHFTWF